MKRLDDGVPASFLLARKTRNRVPLEDWARLAWWYASQVDGGDRNPAATLVAHHPETRLKTWQNAFTRCRTLGLLTPSSRPGLASGMATELTLELLRLQDEVPHEGLVDEYLRTRGTDDGVRERVRETKRQPRRSEFTDDAKYDEAWAAFAHRALWPRSIAPALEAWARRRPGEVLHQRYDDWFDEQRLAQGDDDAYDTHGWRANLVALRNAARLREQISECQSVEDLKVLWASNRADFEADAVLLDAWKTRGREVR